MIASDRALVLRTYPLRESSRIVGLLGREHGRLRLVANAGRGSRHRFGASFEPGNEVELVFAIAAGRELGTVREAALRHAWIAGTPRLEVVATGLAVVELLDRIVPEGGRDAGLFDAAVAALSAQAASRDRAGAVHAFYRFELALLDALGVAPGGLDRAALVELADEQPLDTATALSRRRIGVALHRLLAEHVERYRVPRALALLKKVDSPGVRTAAGGPARGCPETP